MVDDVSIDSVIDRYLSSVQHSRSLNTYRTYKNAMTLFREVLTKHKRLPDKNLITDLREEPIVWMEEALKNYSAASEQCYMTAVVGLYEFVAGENLAEVNLPRVRLLVKQRSRRTGIRLPQFPKSAIETVIDHALELNTIPPFDGTGRLINLRDRAFLVTLADTGLRVHEACKLRRGDLDLHEGRAIVIGKGNKEAVVRISKRATQALLDYFNVRQTIDGASGKMLAALPVFARHDKGVGKAIKPISTTTGRQIVNARVKESVGEEAVGTITPHSFRHYFVTTILVSSGNLKLAQELARHQNIAVTQRYSHLSNEELDKRYLEIFG